jgi:hypothetical protein
MKQKGEELAVHEMQKERFGIYEDSQERSPSLRAAIAVSAWRLRSVSYPRVHTSSPQAQTAKSGIIITSDGVRIYCVEAGEPFVKMTRCLARVHNARLT